MTKKIILTLPIVLATLVSNCQLAFWITIVILAFTTNVNGPVDTVRVQKVTRAALLVASLVTMILINLFVSQYPPNTRHYVTVACDGLMLFTILDNIPISVLSARYADLLASICGIALGLFQTLNIYQFSNRFNLSGTDLLARHSEFPGLVSGRTCSQTAICFILLLPLSVRGILSNGSWWERLIHWISIASLVMALEFTFLRAAFLSLVVWVLLLSLILCRLIVVAHIPRAGLGLIAIILASVICYNFCPPSFMATARGAQTISERRSARARVSALSDSLSVIHEMPVTGIGAGNYALFAPRTKIVGDTTSLSTLNLFTDLLVSYGVLLLIPLSCWLYLSASPFGSPLIGPFLIDRTLNGLVAVGAILSILAREMFYSSLLLTLPAAGLTAYLIASLRRPIMRVEDCES